jgi:hypothetical protein
VAFAFEPLVSLASSQGRAAPVVPSEFNVQRAAVPAMPRGPGNRQGNTCGPIMGEAARFIKFRQVSNIDQRLWNDAVTFQRLLR